MNTAVPTNDRQDRGTAAPIAGPRPRSAEERKVILLSEELARERIRDREREIEILHTAARVRAIRRSRRDARVRAIRVSRILLTR